MDRPPKKPRLLQGPDGFAKPKPTSRYKPPESITNFVSAFDNPVKSTASPSRNKPAHDRPRNPFVDFDVPREPEAGPSKPSVPKRQLKHASFAHPPRTAKADQDKPLPSLKVLHQPVFLPQTTNVAPSHKTAGATPSSLQPTLKPPYEKPRSILKPPPLPIPPLTKPSAPLKHLAPPPMPSHRPPSPVKPMKTIRTTNVAQATDPTKEGTGAELLSIFLQQHGHTFTSSTERERQRGVMVSPDKRSRTKDPTFVRYVVEAPVTSHLPFTHASLCSGGLAERVQHRMACAETDFVLWRRQVEHKRECGTQLTSDMALRILRVLDVAHVPERSRFARAAGPRAGLALCRLTRRHALVSGDLTLGTYVVLFRFGPTHGGRSAVSSVDLFEEGNDVMVWLPWHKVELVGAEACAGLLERVRALDTLTPPHSLLVVSRFCLVAPKPLGECDLT
ncbi:hypothetical protein JVT61DRAFT_11104 [Boletus reticuloceps]|uniref:Uncharacterized protein n=1 Tax=Boletus reticuloceps TaxID=495285 RepID=A0A8I3A3S5_9AGAM|nr:hypothetical protein JVT61DRAFT_11104 [Boletus reticuloceps]